MNQKRPKNYPDIKSKPLTYGNQLRIKPQMFEIETTLKKELKTLHAIQHVPRYLRSCLCLNMDNRPKRILKIKLVVKEQSTPFLHPIIALVKA